MLSNDERATAREMHALIHPYPCRDVDELRAVNRASRERHGDERHEVIKWHAMHAGTDQLAGVSS